MERGQVSPRIRRRARTITFIAIRNHTNSMRHLIPPAASGRTRRVMVSSDAGDKSQDGLLVCPLPETPNSGLVVDGAHRAVALGCLFYELNLAVSTPPPGVSRHVDVFFVLLQTERRSLSDHGACKSCRRDVGTLPRLAGVALTPPPVRRAPRGAMSRSRRRVLIIPHAND